MEEYAREVGIPATFYLPGFYMSNIPGGMFRPSPPDDAWTFGLPTPSSAVIPLFDAAADTGKFVKAIVDKGSEVHGKRVLGATDYFSCDQVIDVFKSTFPVAGETAVYQQFDREGYKQMLRKHLKLSDTIVQELLENMLLLDQCGYFGGDSLDESHAILEDKLVTLEEFFKEKFEGLT